MEYPLHLIPNPDLEIIINPNEEHYLGAWVATNRSFKDSDGKLDAGAIDIKRIPGLSTNKIPESHISDLDIRFVGLNASHLNFTGWRPGDNGQVPSDDDFEVIDRNHYFIQIAEINNFTGDYQNPSDDKSNVYQFTVTVVHKPLIANYWHFELFVSSPNHEFTTTNGKWRGLVYSAIRVKIQDKAVFEI